MASRKEDKERLRQERIEREAAQRERKAKQATARKIAAVIGVVVLIAGAGVAVAVSGGDSKKPSGGTTPGGWPDGPAPASAVLKIDEPDEDRAKTVAAAAGCELNDNPNEGNTHQPDDHEFKFEANPPTSGDHVINPAEDGAYLKGPTAPELVHALEHGRVVFQWNKDKVTDAQVGTLKKLFDNEPYHLILSPNPTKMPSAIAATAWDRSITCPNFSDKAVEALRLFHVTWLDQGPETVP